MLKILLLVVVAVSGSSYSRSSYICPSSFYWTGQTCMPCQPGCTCSSYLGCSGGVACDSGYVQIKGTDTYQCVSCPAGCTSCSVTPQNGFECSACGSYYQLINKVCVDLYPYADQASSQGGLWASAPWTYPSQVSNLNAAQADCQTRSSSTGLCTQCPSGSWLNEVSICENCTAYCSVCASRGTCTTCADGFYWNPSANRAALSNGTGQGGCSACTDVNANTCNATTVLTCNSGYYLNNVTPPACVACSAYCTVCSSATSCTTCMTGAYMTSGTCNLCPGNTVNGTQYLISCVSCTSGQSKTCNTCATNYILVGTQCQACSTITGCAICASKDNVLSCSTCFDGYYLTNTGTCTSCATANPNYYLCQNTDESSATGNIVPTQCATTVNTVFTVSNYFLTELSTNTKLQSCASNTNACFKMSNSTGLCTSCVTGYALISSTSACVACSTIPGCTLCSSPSTGSVPVCTTCASTYVLSSGTCSTCSAGCTVCTSTTACTTCASGYLLTSGSCTACTVSGCTSCPTVSSTCTACASQFFLYTPTSSTTPQQCLLCPPGCATCTNGESCLTCLTGFYQLGNGCSPGAQYCAVHKSDGSCSKCMYGAYILGGSCYPCIQVGYGYVCNSSIILSVLALILLWL